MTDDDQEQENIKGWLQGTTTLSLKARAEATAVAATVLSLSSDSPTAVRSDMVRLADLESLTNQTEGRKTETLKVILDDPNSTCAQFGYEKGSLTEIQAKTMLAQVVSRREIEQKHERELEKIRLQGSYGLFGKVFSWFSKMFGAS